MGGAYVDCGGGAYVDWGGAYVDWGGAYTDCGWCLCRLGGSIICVCAWVLVNNCIAFLDYN